MCNKLIVEDIIQELFQNEITTQNVAREKFSILSTPQSEIFKP